MHVHVYVLNKAVVFQCLFPCLFLLIVKHLLEVVMNCAVVKVLSLNSQSLPCPLSLRINCL